MEKIDTDWETTKLKSLAKLFKPFNRDWAPLNELGQCFLTSSSFSNNKIDGILTLRDELLRECFVTWYPKKLRSYDIDQKSVTSRNEVFLTILYRLDWLRVPIWKIIFCFKSFTAFYAFPKKGKAAVCGLSRHQLKEARKSALLILTVLTNAPHLFTCFSRYQAPTNSVAPSFCI